MGQPRDLSMEMNSPLGKEILALVRKADYAHAGEEEAIGIVFKDIPKDANRFLLDVGCGRGGTAQYVQRGGWGKVVGIDIDSGSIDYAKKTYPDIEFIAGDAMSLARDLSRQFDIIYLFNVFYAISDHRIALEQFRKLSFEAGQLVIFDYLLKPQRREVFPFKEWNPLDFSVMPGLFSAAGWRVVKSDDISALYRKWYEKLVFRIETSSQKIIALAGEEWLDFVRSFYGKILNAIEENLLGGAIVYALRQ
jgi:ubiquinone/menaquinone biosynthesis C-methylase UbiE